MARLTVLICWGSALCIAAAVGVPETPSGAIDQGKGSSSLVEQLAYPEDIVRLSQENQLSEKLSTIRNAFQEVEAIQSLVRFTTPESRIAILNADPHAVKQACDFLRNISLSLPNLEHQDKNQLNSILQPTTLVQLQSQSQSKGFDLGVTASKIFGQPPPPFSAEIPTNHPVIDVVQQKFNQAQALRPLMQKIDLDTLTVFSSVMGFYILSKGMYSKLYCDEFNDKQIVARLKIETVEHMNQEVNTNSTIPEPSSVSALTEEKAVLPVRIRPPAPTSKRSTGCPGSQTTLPKASTTRKQYDEDEFDFDDNRPSPEGSNTSKLDLLKNQLSQAMNKFKVFASSLPKDASGVFDLLADRVKVNPEEYCAHPDIKNAPGWKLMDLALSFVGGADPSRFDPNSR